MASLNVDAMNVVAEHVDLDVDLFHDAMHEVQHEAGRAPGAQVAARPPPLQYEQAVVETVRVERPGSAPAAPGYDVHYSPQSLQGAQTDPG